MTLPKKPTAMWRQIRDYYLGQMATGRLQPGAPMPTERQMTALFGVSLQPVRQAMDVLADNGYIVREGGRGTRVADPLPVIHPSQLPEQPQTAMTASDALAVLREAADNPVMDREALDVLIEALWIRAETGERPTREQLLAERRWAEGGLTRQRVEAALELLANWGYQATADK